MANTFELIDKYTVSSTQSTITFSAIPGTYTDLCLKISARTTRNFGVSYDGMSLQFNGSTSTYATRMVYGDGSGSGSATSTLSNKTDWSYATSSLSSANVFGSAEIYIPNYTSTTAPKPMSSDSVGENSGAQSILALTSSNWNPGTQAAITSIVLSMDSGSSFVQYTTAYLYGVKNA